MGGRQTVIVAGIGCRPGCAAVDIVAVTRTCMAATSCAATVLAVPEFRATLPAVTEAAHILGLPIVVVARSALAETQPRCATRSAAALAATGLASIAESAALAAAGSEAVLLHARIAYGDATCALAAQPSP